VLALLAALLAVLEIVTRVKLYAMSSDFSTFLSYAGRAADLSRRGGLRLAIVGNSVAHEGIDPGVFAERLRDITRRETFADAFTVNHSFIETWYHMLRHYLWQPGYSVDLVVLPFWRNNLEDGNPLEIGRLAQFFTTFADWSEVLHGDLRTTAQRLDFVTSGVWATYAARDHIREFLFTRAFPGYQDFVRAEQAAALSRDQAATASRRSRVRPSFRTLDRLLREARAHGAALCFVAMPTLHPEWNDPYTEVRSRIAEAGMAYLDLRGLSEMNERRYVDRVHMNDSGRSLFSRRLAENLAPILQTEVASPRASPVLAPAADFRYEAPRW